MSINLPNEFKYVYHRTAFKNVASIVKSGFKPGFGDMYGSGLYTCYDISSQLSSIMKIYGDALIKFELFNKGILIFDYNISKKIYGNKYSILDQVDNLGIIDKSQEAATHWRRLSEAAEGTFRNEKFSAELAYNVFVDGSDPYDFSKQYFKFMNNGKPIDKEINAIMFSGNHDGNVCVIYSPDTAKPLEYSIIDDSILTESDINWIKVSDFDKANKRTTLLRKFYDIFNNSFEKINISDEYDVNRLDREYKWLNHGKFRNAKLTIDEKGECTFDGVWESGEFKGANFYGEFRGGKFSGARFYGTFIFGAFVKGGFQGTWLKGNWKVSYENYWGSIAHVNIPGTFNYLTEDGDIVTSQDMPPTAYPKYYNFYKKE